MRGDVGLAAKLAEAKGYNLNVIRQVRGNRVGTPIIFPLVRDHEGAFISKRSLLTMPDGSVATEWNAECFGQTVLNTALAAINNNPAIFASHEWCKPVLPYNVERTPFDVRGLNEWRDKHVSIHMLHGNPSPDELGPINRILRKMGVPLKDGKDALRWEREGDQVVQFAHRTSVRDESSESNTYHFVTSYTQARRLAFDFGCSCLIDTSFMVDPPEKAPTEAQDARQIAQDELTSQVRSLLKAGMSQREIAKTLGTNQSKVKRIAKTI